MNSDDCVVCGFKDVTIAHLEEEIIRLVLLSAVFGLPKDE